MPFSYLPLRYWQSFYNTRTTRIKNEHLLLYRFWNCTLTLPIVTVLSSDQTRCPAVPGLFIDPVGNGALQMWNKALSCQHSTLYRLQNTIGLVGCSGLFVSVKALSVYRKYCTAALCQRATIRVAKSACIGMNTSNPQTEDRLGKRKQRENVWFTVIGIWQ